MKTEEMLSQPLALPDGVDYDEYIIATYVDRDAVQIPPSSAAGDRGRRPRPSLDADTG